MNKIEHFRQKISPILYTFKGILGYWRTKGEEEVNVIFGNSTDEGAGLSIQQIAKQLKVSRTTVYNYMEKTPEEAFEWVNSLGWKKEIQSIQGLDCCLASRVSASECVSNTGLAA